MKHLRANRREEIKILKIRILNNNASALRMRCKCFHLHRLDFSLVVARLEDHLVLSRPSSVHL